MAIALTIQVAMVLVFLLALSLAMLSAKQFFPKCYLSFALTLSMKFAKVGINYSIGYAVVYATFQTTLVHHLSQTEKSLFHWLLKESPGLQRIGVLKNTVSPDGLSLFTRLKVSFRDVFNQYIRIFTN